MANPRFLRLLEQLPERSFADGNDLANALRGQQMTAGRSGYNRVAFDLAAVTPRPGLEAGHDSGQHMRNATNVEKGKR